MSEWSQVKKFVEGESRPDLVFELLANVDLLADEDRRRSAVIEVISALEVAVNEFAEHPKADSFIARDLKGRVDLAKLKQQVKHLGFTATVRYLIPLLLDDTKLSRDTLQTCQRALDVRGNIAHEGQRDVTPADTRLSLRAVRRMCEVLKEHTKSRGA